MVVMSDAESFGLKLTCLILAIALLVILFSKDSFVNNQTNQDAIPMDTVTLFDTIVVHDTIYKYKPRPIDTSNKTTVTITPIVIDTINN